MSLLFKIKLVELPFDQSNNFRKEEQVLSLPDCGLLCKSGFLNVKFNFISFCKLEHYALDMNLVYISVLYEWPTFVINSRVITA